MKTVRLNCKNCERSFLARQNDVSRGMGKFCTRKCFGEFRRRLTRASRAKFDQPIDHRLIPLPHGLSAAVSIDDYDYLNETNWHLSVGGYVVSRVSIRMSRVVASRMLGGELLADLDVDHISGDKLDNRRENLRAVSKGDNCKNRTVNSTSATGAKGVFPAPSGRFVAAISAEGTRVYIGTFPTVDVAAWMYDQYAIELHGEFARLNSEYV